MGFVLELFRSHKVIFKNFGTDFLSLLNSDLELDQNFKNLVLRNSRFLCYWQRTERRKR
jgi:hypothetical protein